MLQGYCVALLLTVLLAFQPAESSPSPADLGPVLTDEAVLSSAYPNPFTTHTRFSVSVDERQKVTVEVFNVLGQRVRVLYNDYMDPDLTRDFTLWAGDLPAGIYLYRAEGEHFIATRRVMLLR